MRRAVAFLAMAIGVGLMVVPIASSMIARTADAERILDRFEFLTLDDNPARYLHEAEITRAGSAELVDDAIPDLALDAGVDGGELDRLARTTFPALAAAQEEISQAHDFSVRYSEQLDAVDDKFQSIYDIPVRALPLTATPWLFLVVGLASLAAGMGALLTTGRKAPAVMLTLGIAMVLGPLALSAPGKAADGENVKAFASRGLTTTAATAAQEAWEALAALVDETKEKTLPYLARLRGVPVARLEDELGGEFLAAGRFLAEWDVIGPRLARLSDAVAVSVNEFESARRLPISLPVWLLLGSGIVLSLASGIALARGGTARSGSDGVPR
jgi:hypothetical protein